MISAKRCGQLAAGALLVFAVAGCAGRLPRLVPLNKDLSPEDLQYVKDLKPNAKESSRCLWVMPFYMRVEEIQPLGAKKDVCAARLATAPAPLPGIGFNFVNAVLFDYETGKRRYKIREVSFFAVFSWMHGRDYPTTGPSHIKAWEYDMALSSMGFGANPDGWFGKFLCMRFGPGRKARVDDPMREAEDSGLCAMPPAPTPEGGPAPAVSPRPPQLLPPPPGGG